VIFNYDSYFDVIVICGGHNDLTYTYNLTKAGFKVLVLEDYHTLECITITEELTDSGFKSDVHAFGY
jgi:phytoene dehydrogenase-like protein